MGLERHAFAYRIGAGHFEDVRSLLGERWQTIKDILDSAGAGNFSLWQIGELVFGYYETDGAAALPQPGGEKLDALITQAAALGEWISSPREQMRLMYQDFGIVRPNKELIRHRVFATKLKGDFQEEYKRRHDALVEARNGEITRGPDSNFSIWNAGRYIFGYNEIDTTMEQEETAGSRQDTIDWETKMLEIMDWFTDDVDWITGAHHPHVQRIAWYGGSR